MNFEKINQIITPVEADNKIEREQKLNEKITEISLIYALNKFNKNDSVGEREPFLEVLKNHTPIENFIKKPLYQLIDFRTDDYQEKIDNYLNDFYQKADELNISSLGDLELILNLVKEKKDNIIKFLEVENLPTQPKEIFNQGTDLISYNEVLPNNGLGRYQELIEKHFSKMDSFLEVHFESLFTKEDELVSPDKIRKDFSNIAKEIVLKKPETAAVIGQSWLLDTPIATRLGFNKEDSVSVLENDLSTWLQFIDKDGQINKGRFKKLIDTGELPFKSVQAYIKTEDFLKQYLPSDLRGEIILKEINEAEAEKQINLTKEELKLKDYWEQAIDSSNFDFFISNESFNSFINYLDKEDKNKFIDFLKLMFNNGIKDFSKMRTPEIKQISQNLREAKRKKMYQDKKVFID
jgi:hypothetical protein